MITCTCTVHVQYMKNHVLRELAQRKQHTAYSNTCTCNVHCTLYMYMCTCVHCTCVHCTCTCVHVATQNNKNKIKTTMTWKIATMEI